MKRFMILEAILLCSTTLIFLFNQDVPLKRHLHLSFAILKKKAPGRESIEMLRLDNSEVHDKYEKCLSELASAEKVLEILLRRLNECKEKYEEKKRAFDLQKKVCESMHKEYKKYCKGTAFKAPFLDEEQREEYMKSLSRSRQILSELIKEATDQKNECSSIQEKVDSAQDKARKIEKRCASMEYRLYQRRPESTISLIEDPELMDKPFENIGAEDREALLLLLDEYRQKYQRCISGLEAITMRTMNLQQKMYDIQQSAEQEEMSRKVNVKNVAANLFKKKKSKSQRKSKRFPRLEKQFTGAKKHALQKDKECKRLEEDIRKLEERLAKSEASQSQRQPRRNPCLRFITRIRDGITGITRRFVRNRQ